MSLRTLTGPADAALDTGAVLIGLFLELLYSPTPVRFSTFAVPVDWNGNTYLGAGPLGSVDPVRDTSGELAGMRFTLGAVDPTYLSLAFATSARGVDCQLRAVIGNADTHAILDAPIIYTGKLDSLPVQFGTQTGAISAASIHRGKLFTLPRPFRYTDADQQLKAPGDTSARFAISQAEQQDVWPAAAWYRK